MPDFIINLEGTHSVANCSYREVRSRYTVPSPSLQGASQQTTPVFSSFGRLCLTSVRRTRRGCSSLSPHAPVHLSWASRYGVSGIREEGDGEGRGCLKAGANMWDDENSLTTCVAGNVQISLCHIVSMTLTLVTVSLKPSFYHQLLVHHVLVHIAMGRRTGACRAKR